MVKEGDKVYCITEYTYEEEPEHLEQPTIRLVGFMIYVCRLWGILYFEIQKKLNFWHLQENFYLV